MVSDGTIPSCSVLMKRYSWRNACTAIIEKTFCDAIMSVCFTLGQYNIVLSLHDYLQKT